MPHLLRLGMLTRLLLAFAVLLAPLMGFSVWSYVQSLHDRREAALDDTVQASQTAAALVHGLIRDLDGTTQALAQGLGALPPAIPYTQEAIHPFLANPSSRYPFLRLLFLTDLAGTVLASATGEGVGTSLAERPYVLAVRAGQDEVLTDATPALLTALPLVTLARTVRAPDGTPRGILAASFYAERLEAAFPGGLPADSRLSVYDRRGFLLYHSTVQSITPAQREQGSHPDVRAALAGQIRRRPEFHSEIDGQQRLGAVVPVPEIGWVVSVSRNLSVVDADIERVYRLHAIVLAGLVIGAALLSIVISRALSRPLELLAVQAREFGQGRRSAPAPHYGPPEVKALSVALTQMASEVDARFAEREAAVKALAESEARLRLLSAISEALSASMDQEAIVQSLATMVVPGLADGAAVHLAMPGGGIRVAALAHDDQNMGAALQQARDHAPLSPDAPVGYPCVLRTGEPELIARVSGDILSALARDPEQEHLLRALGLRSTLCVPLMARGRILGTLTLVHAGSGRRFSDDDLPLAMEIGRRGALALENAELYQNAQQALLARDEFLSSVSHDLRSPLTSIVGMSQILQRRLRRLELVEVSECQAMLSAIDHAAGRMQAMVEELLDLARWQAGRTLELRREVVDLVGLARRVAADQSRLAGGRPITVASDPASVSGHWDAARLERVLANLLANALKYSTEPAPILVSIARVSGPNAAPWAEVSVRDEGLGIPEADLPHISERFYRGANVRGRVPGTGLGLAGARRIVEAHGGTLAIASVAGQGTTVTLRLPLVAENDDGDDVLEDAL